MGEETPEDFERALDKVIEEAKTKEITKNIEQQQEKQGNENTYNELAIVITPKKKPNLRFFGGIVAVVIFIIIIILVAGISLNVITLDFGKYNTIIDEVITQDYRNEGIKVNVYTDGFSSSVLVYDLQSVSYDKSRADIFRVFLQFAEKVSSEYFSEVKLAYKGIIKFRIDGWYFQQLGEEYFWQNPVYTIRTFPEHLKYPSGIKAYPTWTGGIIGVTTEQMEDFNDFHDKWYLDDMLYSK